MILKRNRLTFKCIAAFAAIDAHVNITHCEITDKSYITDKVLAFTKNFAQNATFPYKLVLDNLGCHRS